MLTGIARRHHGFTLVEMLVVIAIIGILASLLMPSLMRGLDSARAIACANNLKQLGVVNMTYANDFNGFYMPTSYGGDFGSGYGGAGGSFTSFLQGYIVGAPLSAWGPGLCTNSIWKANKGQVMFFCCPNDKNPGNLANNSNPTDARCVSYHANTKIWMNLGNRAMRYPSGSGNTYFLRAAEIRRPGATTFMGDADGRTTWASYYLQPTFSLDWSNPPGTPLQTDYGNLFWYAVRLGHSQGSGYNALYFDGHLSSFVYPNYDVSLVSSLISGL